MISSLYEQENISKMYREIISIILIRSQNGKNNNMFLNSDKTNAMVICNKSRLEISYVSINMTCPY